jgi:hypothetical protein
MTQPQHSPKYLDNERHTDGKKSAFQKTTLRSTLTALHAAQPKSILLRDGELVLYRRSRSLLYQCRYRLADGSWVRQTTGMVTWSTFHSWRRNKCGRNLSVHQPRGSAQHGCLVLKPGVKMIFYFNPLAICFSV